MNNNIIEEYKNLENIIETEKGNLNLIQSKIKIFLKSLSILKEDLISTSDINGPFFFLNKIFQKFIKIITREINLFNDKILIPFDNLIESYKFGTEKNLNSYKEIEEDLENAEKNLLNQKEVIFNYIKESENESKISKKIISKKTKENDNNDNNNILTKKDENIFNNAIKENYNQLYQYELNKMDEIIEENNIKFNDIYKEINTLTAVLRLSLEDLLMKFSKNIADFSEAFNTFSKDIIKEINASKIKREQLDKSVHRFTITSREMVKLDEDKKENEKKEKEKKASSLKDKIKLFNLFSSKRKTTISIFPNKMNINKSENDFQNIDKEKEEKNKEYIVSFIRKIVDEKEIKSKEIIDLFNILNINELDYKDNKMARNFLNMLKKYYKQRIISFKNKNNFIHLSNIINSLCLKYKKNYNILILIVEVSQMIKYKNDYMYKIVQRRNEFLSTKTLWLQLIDDELMEALNEYADDKINKEMPKKSSYKEKEDSKKNILEILELSKKITNYKKLNKNQKNELLKFGKEKICIIISKSISGMSSFLVPENVINEIIVYYGTQFKLEYDLKCYLKDKILLKNIKIRNQIKYCAEKDEKLYNKIIIISSVAKYFPIKDYPQLLKLELKLYKNLRKKIFLDLLSDKKLSIESHLLLWKEYLEVDKLKIKFKYKDIKEVIYISLDKEEINEEIREEKNIYIIQKDLERTKFLNEHKEYFKSFKSILISFLFLFPKIGYCQGMHYIVSLLYQILNYDEEETFYFFCAILLNTKYHEIFEDDFNTLKTFFQIFEKILNIKRPEIYYKFMDSRLVTNTYISPWFITLFTESVTIFDKNNIPKFAFFIIEKFIIEGWSVIFNCSLTLLEYCYDKIMTLEQEKLLYYILNIFENEEILENKNFEKAKSLYLKNSTFLNEFFFDKLLAITKFEEKNKYLNEIIDIIGITNY